MDNADLVELFRLQKQVRLELHEVGESVNRLAARSGESDAELKQAMKLAMARNDTAQLADAVTRLTTQSAQTSTVLAEVLRALAAQAKTTKDDFESFLALVDEVKDEMHSLRDRFEHQSDERGGSATPEPDEPDAGTPSK